MAAGTIVPGTARQDGANAYVSVLVGNVEYNAQTPLLDTTGAAKPLAQVKADLLAAVTSQLPKAAPTTLPGISGAVTV